ncbi:MAG: GTPase HflX [Candidatus Mcinerneyibacterium aminivorans]|uniref:GTPase HflX n=1 Tax=Candidatus Mcinerneyibacterium aminivorans TaxID=2703815 RepID=A0A5D0MIV9_9BACT|nr:MAG: GTPase HflX [Candidatus Mcinerneyibacterium aminivorans]
MKVRREISKNCVLLSLITPEKKDEYKSSIKEMKALTQTRGGKIVKTITQKRGHPDPGYFFGKGKLKQIKSFLDKYPKIGNVIVEGFLSPTQQRNMEKLLETTVIDREELILEIFSKRAKTREAKLQVELAEYEYLLPRLRNMWPHLSRQAGGGFKLRGPGETQLEMDKQVIQKRISSLKDKIEHVKKVRKQQRKRRKNLFTVSIVGYTNAGKSTLLTQLSNSDLYTEDKLFATLDTSTKRVYIGEGNTILMSDTVGFIKNLPPHLFASFKSTLEEIKYNDLIIILIDVTDDNYRKKIKVVEKVLKELGVVDKKLVYVFNKIDLIPKDKLKLLKQKFQDKENYLFISALKKTNLDKFRNYLLKVFKKFNREDKYNYQSLD